MTREKAIDILKTDNGCSDCTWGCETPLKCANKDCLFVKALEMAISALEQNPNKSEIPTSCDTISREAVNALYDKWRPRLATHVSEFGDELKSLPSVQPSRKGHWIKVDKGTVSERVICSECKQRLFQEHKNYCGYCGACMKDGRTLDEFIEDMRGDTDENRN